MHARFKDLLRRLNIHIIFMVFNIYVILVAFDIWSVQSREVLFMTILIIIIILMVRFFPKNNVKTVVVTPLDKKKMEYLSYGFSGLFLLQYLLNGSSIAFLRGYIGLIMMIINVFIMYTIYKIIK